MGTKCKQGTLMNKASFQFCLCCQVDQYIQNNTKHNDSTAAIFERSRKQNTFYTFTNNSFTNSNMYTVVVAEWLRRWTRNPLGSSRAGSNPADNEYFYVNYLPSNVFTIEKRRWKQL